LEQQIRFCSAYDGVRLAYATHGRAPPVPNWLTHLEFDWKSRLWGRPWLEGLGETNRVIRYDEIEIEDILGDLANVTVRSAVYIEYLHLARAHGWRFRAISSERWPPTIRTDRSALATGTTIVRAWPPTTRCTSSDGSAVVRA
jgi:hypothetical protein